MAGLRLYWVATGTIAGFGSDSYLLALRVLTM